MSSGRRMGLRCKANRPEKFRRENKRVALSVENLASYQLKSLMQTIHSVYGYDFTQYAESSLLRRSLRFMQANKILSIDQLSSILLNDEKKFEEFIRTLSVTVTEMFRDPSFYLALRERVVPRLRTYPFLKIWIAGCATGEEVFSMAILLKEEELLDRTIIYATDINQHSLYLAKEGIFPIEFMKTYTENYQRSGGKNDFSAYYLAKYNSAMFDKNLKRNVVFAAHNLATDQSFNEFHLIMCRNVLIYFNQELQNKVINLFYDSLCPFGFLGLGSKESLLFSDKKPHFEKFDKKDKLFIRLN
jgi:chemotaxis protein methyltransferase CheR